MRELGGDAERYHEEIGARAAGAAQVLVAVGEFADAMSAATAGPERWRAAEAADAADLVREVVRDGDVVLVKASRGVGLERVTQALTEPSIGD